MRGVAALTVVLGHTIVTQSQADRGTFLSEHVAVISDGSIFASLLSELRVGVTIFFLLSGLLLYRPFAAAHADGERMPRLGAYAVRRVLRIVPAYWVALLGTLILGGATVFLTSPKEVVRLFGFLQIYSVDTYSSGLGVAWSLCIEITFYAVLPLIAFVVHRLLAHRRQGWLTTELTVLGIVALCAMAYRATILITWHEGVVPPLAIRMLPSYLDLFALGMALAVLSVHIERGGRIPAVLRVVGQRAWIAVGAAFGIYVFACALDPGSTRASVAEHYFEMHTLLGLTAALLLLPVVISSPRDGLWRRALGSRFMVYVGLVSYGVYLWHTTLVPEIARTGIDDALGVPDVIFWPVATTLVTLAVATVSFYAIERPAMALKRHFGGMPMPDPAQTLVGARP